MSSPQLSVWSGVGLVVGNMVGSGVFLSTGFMVQDLSGRTILVAWLVGTAFALCGALSYATLAELVPQSGGEYRYLSDLVHPALGYLAGWASVLVGFSGPVAIGAIAAAAFLKTLIPAIGTTTVAIVLVLAITLLHTANLRASQIGQDLLVALKILIVIAFLAVGLASTEWQASTGVSPQGGEGFRWSPFMASLFYIAFAFSGWNAAVYASEEFGNPKRDVARATIWGCLGVGVVYLLINWVFVANLKPEMASAVHTYEETRITLAHVLIAQWLGDTAGHVASLMMVVALISAASAMMFVGPRVCAAMAQDGFLPRIFAKADGRPPVGSVLLQGAIAIVIVLVQPFQEIMHDVSAILTLFTLVTVLTLFKVRFSRRDVKRPSAFRLVAAAAYAMLALWMLYFGLRAKTHLVLWMGLVAALALLTYGSTNVVRKMRGQPSSS